MTPKENDPFASGIAHIYVSSYLDNKYEFVIDGQHFIEALANNGIKPEDGYKELTSATIYYQTYVKTNLFGWIAERKYEPIKVDFHIKK